MKNKNEIPNYDELFDDYQKLDKNSPVKTLWLLLKHDRWRLLLAVFVYFLKNSPFMLMPWFTGQIIKVVETKSDNINILYIALIYGLLLLSNIPLHYLYVRLLMKPIRKMEAGIRATLVRKLQSLSIQYYKEMMSGKLQSKVLRDVEQIQMLCTNLFNLILPGLISFIFALSMAASKNWMIATMYVLLVPINSIMVFTMRNKMYSQNNEYRIAFEGVSASVSEMIGMIPVTRAHGLERTEIDKMDNKLNNVSKAAIKLDLVNGWFGASSWVLFMGTQLTCLLFMSFLASKSIITVSEVVMYQTYFTQIVGAFNGVIGFFPQFAIGFECVRSVSEVLSAQNLEDKDGIYEPVDVKGNYEFRDLYYKYPNCSEDDYILKDFNLAVNAGESVAFVGESGSGKSTLINLIIGYDNPSEGLLLVDRVNIKNLDLTAYRKHIAVVPQNNVLFSGTIRDNILYGLKDVSEEKLDEVLEMANIKEFISNLPNGLDTFVGESGGKISGGQRQRIAIARALIRDPKVIIFDEATSALDSVSEAKVQQAINSMMKNRTVFIVAHRLSTIKEADKIVVLKKGRCVESGTFDELMAQKGEFYNYKKLQS